MAKRKKEILNEVDPAGLKYQTIASRNKNYEPYEIMHTYNSIGDARSHFTEDINELIKAKGKGSYGHYDIKLITKDEVAQ